ncbi:hypothetical protein [Nocardioides sp.]|uniref:hypothetical protein n=1 Tax=Nocardioides sp. TaxID=35761 RepID=UPI00286E5C73|nr:hypothetical protein [Nocardioides sp.]
METASSLAAALLQAGILMLIVIVGQAYAVAHVPVESIPTTLRHRVEVCTRLRPLLVVAALSLTVAGLVLQVS